MFENISSCIFWGIFQLRAYGVLWTLAEEHRPGLVHIHKDAKDSRSAQGCSEIEYSGAKRHKCILTHIRY